jgi:hypothetical protein
MVMTGGALLILFGILHNVVGLPALQRAVSRGELAQRLAAPHMVNWFFSGAAISLLGVVVLLAAWERGGTGRLAERVVVLTGIFFVGLGLMGYALESRPAVLVFTVLGLLLCAPVLLSPRRARSKER